MNILQFIKEINEINEKLKELEKLKSIIRSIDNNTTKLLSGSSRTIIIRSDLVEDFDALVLKD